MICVRVTGMLVISKLLIYSFISWLFSRLGMINEENVTSLEFNNSGCYPTVCVELSIDGLAVNTVLQVQKSIQPTDRDTR